MLGAAAGASDSMGYVMAMLTGRLPDYQIQSSGDGDDAIDNVPGVPGHHRPRERTLPVLRQILAKPATVPGLPAILLHTGMRLLPNVERPNGKHW